MGRQKKTKMQCQNRLVAKLKKHIRKQKSVPLAEHQTKLNHERNGKINILNGETKADSLRRLYDTDEQWENDPKSFYAYIYSADRSNRLQGTKRKLTPEERRETHAEYLCDRAKLLRESETKEQREMHVKKSYQMSETEEERQIRLNKVKAYRLKRIAAETEEERDERIKKRREFRKKLRLSETKEQREKRLKYSREYMRTYNHSEKKDIKKKALKTRLQKFCKEAKG